MAVKKYLNDRKLLNVIYIKWQIISNEIIYFILFRIDLILAHLYERNDLKIVIKNADLKAFAFIFDYRSQ